MKYEIKRNSDGKVDYIMESGNDLVTGSMNIDSVKTIEKSAEVKKSAFKSYPIQMGIFHFKGKIR